MMGQRTAADDWNWRRVPRISLVPAGTDQRWSVISLVFALLVIAISFWALVIYLGLGSEKELVEVRRNALAGVEGRLAGLNDEIADVFRQIDVLTPRRDELLANTETVVETAAPFLWESAIEALLGLDDADVRVETVTTLPSGDVTVGGTTGDARSLGRLQAQLGRAADAVEVVGFQWTEVDGGITYTARLRALR